MAQKLDVVMMVLKVQNFKSAVKDRAERLEGKIDS